MIHLHYTLIFIWNMWLEKYGFCFGSMSFVSLLHTLFRTKISTVFCCVVVVVVVTTIWWTETQLLICWRIDLLYFYWVSLCQEIVLSFLISFSWKMAIKGSRLIYFLWKVFIFIKDLFVSFSYICLNLQARSCIRFSLRYMILVL